MPDRIPRPCRTCSRPVTAPNGGRGQWQRYCSDECRPAPKGTLIRQLRPGERVPPGEPKRYDTAQGYIRVRWKVGVRQYVETYEHRIAGDRVTDAEHVHHIDHDRTNNTPDNLDHLTEAEHAQHHADLRRRVDHERVVDLYRQGMLQIDVAAALRCDSSTVSRILKAGGIRARPPAKRYPWPDEQATARAVAASSSSHQVAVILGVPVATARAAMAHHGIPAFPPGRPRAAAA